MPAPTDVKILFVGDMHLGRSASRIPDRALELGGFSRRDLSPVAAWQQVVKTAVELAVDAVALAGDLVHSEDDLFEARAHLQRGITNLNQAGIKVAAVAGNHDTRILPTLAKTVEGLHLLGPNGTWSTLAITPRVRLAGWSFPAPHHTTSPLDTPPPAAQPNVVTLGLLHADLDVSASNYAPVSSDALAATGYQGWALGHIHIPGPEPTPDHPAQPFYLGAINGSIPTETGEHGPVLATITPDGTVTWQRHVQAPMCWRHRDILITNLPPQPHQDALRSALCNYLLEQVCREKSGTARAMGLRLTLTGTHPQADVLQSIIPGLKPEDLVTLNGSCVTFIEKITNEVTIPLDLAALARRADLPGLVAREIIALEAGNPTSDELIRQGRTSLATLPVRADLTDTDLDDDELRRLLGQAGRKTLNVLLANHNEIVP